jgi:hypothetical protein
MGFKTAKSVKSVENMINRSKSSVYWPKFQYTDGNFDIFKLLSDSTSPPSTRRKTTGPASVSPGAGEGFHTTLCSHILLRWGGRCSQICLRRGRRRPTRWARRTARGRPRRGAVSGTQERSGVRGEGAGDGTRGGSGSSRGEGATLNHCFGERAPASFPDPYWRHRAHQKPVEIDQNFEFFSFTTLHLFTLQ